MKFDLSILIEFVQQFGETLEKGPVSLDLNPFTPISDQNRISPLKINTISSRQVMRIKKISVRIFSVDPIPNSQNYHHENCAADSEENRSGIRGLN